MNSLEGILATGITLLGVAVASHGVPGREAAALPHQYAALALRADRGPDSFRSNLVIREMATGRVLATVTAPRPANSFCDLSGTPDGRTFVAEACKVTVKRLLGGFLVRTRPVRFARLTVDGQGQVGRLRPLRVPVPGGTRLDGAAVSPGGRMLAVASAVHIGAFPHDPLIRLYDLGTGRLLRTWRWAGRADITGRSPVGSSASPLSWTADGATIAFPILAGRQQRAQVRLLDTAAPGGNLRRTRVVLDFGPTQLKQFSMIPAGPDSMITPDGTRIVASTAVVSRHPASARMTVSEFSVASGARLAVLHTVTLDQGSATFLPVLWSSPDGSTVIAAGGLGNGLVLIIGVMTGGGFTRLPGSMAGIIQLAF